MRFNPRLPNDTMTLLMLAVFVIVILGIVASSGDPALSDAKTISATGSACLLIVLRPLAGLLSAQRSSFR
jgi:hypothetical protein